ncbi:MAG: flippase-like domain-containing protein [Candidatus Marinimicrobia bacterium]|nr:flippase-like domain-containing protein [Candidatus Neomarinimicrobiota bacterium]
MKKRLIAGLIISIVFLYFAFRDVNWQEFSRSLLSVNFVWLIPAAISVIASFVIRAIRWKMLIDPVQKVSYGKTFSATMIGYMGNNVLPFRLGDLLRAYVFSKNTGLSKSSTLASLLLERILDLLTTLAALGIVLAYFPRFPTWASSVGYAALIIVIVLLAATLLLQYRSESVIKLSAFILKPMPDKWAAIAGKKLASFSEGLEIVSHYKKYFGILIVSVLHWPIYISTVWFTFRAFGYSYGGFEAFVVLVFITFAVAIPSAPGYVGTFHGLVVASMALFGLTGGPARAFAVVLHAVNYFPVTAVGFYFFWKGQLTFREVETQVEEYTDDKGNIAISG